MQPLVLVRERDADVAGVPPDRRFLLALAAQRFLDVREVRVELEGECALDTRLRMVRHSYGDEQTITAHLVRHLDGERALRYAGGVDGNRVAGGTGAAAAEVRDLGIDINER